MDHIFCLSHFLRRFGPLAWLIHGRNAKDYQRTGLASFYPSSSVLYLWILTCFFLLAHSFLVVLLLKINEACVLITLTRRIYTVVFCSFLGLGGGSLRLWQQRKKIDFPFSLARVLDGLSFSNHRFYLNLIS